MGDRPRTISRVRMSEDKMRRKDMCWSVRIVCLIKLPEVSGPGLEEAGRYNTQLAEVSGLDLEEAGRYSTLAEHQSPADMKKRCFRGGNLRVLCRGSNPQQKHITIPYL